MSTVLSSTPSHAPSAPRVTETLIERNRDGSHFVDLPSCRVTHTDETGDDVLLVDAGTELSLVEAAELHRALGLLLDHADPNRTMRHRIPAQAFPMLAPPSCTDALDEAVERRQVARAHELVATGWTADDLHLHLAAAPWFGGDPDEKAAFAKAIDLLGGAA